MKKTGKVAIKLVGLVAIVGSIIAVAKCYKRKTKVYGELR